MKLVDILARELKEWPFTVDTLGQTASGRLHTDPPHERWLESYTLASDWVDAIVTRAQWQAAVDAMKPDWSGEGLPPVGAFIEYVSEISEDDDYPISNWLKGDILEVLAIRKVHSVELPVVFNPRTMTASAIMLEFVGKIRTAEQQGVDALCEFVKSVAGGNDFFRTFWERAYAAGLRAPVQP